MRFLHVLDAISACAGLDRRSFNGRRRVLIIAYSARCVPAALIRRECMCVCVHVLSGVLFDVLHLLFCFHYFNGVPSLLLADNYSLWKITP